MNKLLLFCIATKLQIAVEHTGFFLCTPSC